MKLIDCRLCGAGCLRSTPRCFRCGAHRDTPIPDVAALLLHAYVATEAPHPDEVIEALDELRVEDEREEERASERVGDGWDDLTTFGGRNG